MKIYNKFVESKKEPSNKNDIWFDGSTIRLYNEGEWYTVTLSKEALEKLVKYAENVKIFKYVDTLPEIGDPSLIYFQKELSGGGIILVPYVYDDEWKQITNTEVFSESSPFGFGKAENSAVLKGGNNQVTNANEVALGKYNESNNDTLFSIGIGTSDADRKNALEVKQNGGIYIEGVEKPIQIKLTELENKVDKEEGKGLSSNDFTNALKEKLEGLENYNDAEISSAVEKLSRDFNALLGNNASAAIESFNEIIAFLEGIEDSASLDAIVASIQQEIARVSDALTEASSEIEVLAIEVESQNEMIEDLRNTKIDKEADDYYPQLSVGLADNLAGVDVVDSKISFRRSGGGAISDGVARIEAIKGNSLVWNQKVRNVLDTTGAEGWWKRGNTQLSLDGNKIIMATGASGLTMMSQKVDFIEGHQYLIAFDVETVTDFEQISLQIIQAEDVYGNTQKTIASILQKDARLASFYTASADMPYIAIYHQAYLNEGDTTTFDGIKVIDLTLMFGVGNEPTTIEEFNARKPFGIDENAYNEGEVIHMDVQSLESVGVNQWDGEWEQGDINATTGVELPSTGDHIRTGFIRVIPNLQYYISIQGKSNRTFLRTRLYDAEKNFIGIVSASGADIYTNEAFTIPSNAHYIRFAPKTSLVSQSDLLCINLSDASINGKYFPYIKRIQSLDIIGKYFPEGMKSAGTAHDEIRYNKATQKWEKVQRIGSVDMGSLTWKYSSITSSSVPYDVIFAYDIRNICKHPAINSIANILSYKYITTLNTALASRVMEDKSIMLYRDGTIYIRDTAYTDTASFKAAMDGVTLYYELAEPIVTELDDDSNLDYEVWNDGTEKILSDVPTTPLKADIAYGFNAVGKIKENAQKIKELEENGGGVSKDYVDGKLTELSAEVSGLSERIDKLPTAESSVFEAIYEQTKYADIVAAYNANKHVILKSGVNFLSLAKVTSNQVDFTAVSATDSTLVRCFKSDTWAMYSITLERTINKTKSISEGSTDDQYPSAKAVYDFVSNTLGTIINGDY